ncbi:asparaginase [Galactobacter valiniphilus]|uniref:asparaginase n=1 Tax=Galactobacter valiniphilus TaxID=2676122 RepID=UPI003734E8D3
MSHPISLNDVVELATVSRNGVIESRHLGSLAVVDRDGALIATLGNPEAEIYARSSLKPFQAIASLRAGAQLNDERLALACASHRGTFRHQELAATVLEATGLSEADLRCPPDYPQDSETYRQTILDGNGKNRLAFNCSGKHAGFLTACVASGWPTEGYLDPNHPLQRSVMDVVEEFSGAPVGNIAIDGCGAPVPQMPLVGLARATAKMLRLAADGSDDPAARVAPAMLAHPWAVHGEGAENTVVMERLGVVAKLGAEGVLILGAPDGTSLALKMLDGSSRANTVVGLRALQALGVLEAAAVDAVLAEVLKPVLGGGNPVGAIVPAEAVSSLARA